MFKTDFDELGHQKRASGKLRYLVIVQNSESESTDWNSDA